jgi:hypothetical protein
MMYMVTLSSPAWGNGRLLFHFLVRNQVERYTYIFGTIGGKWHDVDETLYLRTLLATARLLCRLPRCILFYPNQYMHKTFT